MDYADLEKRYEKIGSDLLLIAMSLKQIGSLMNLPLNRPDGLVIQNDKGHDMNVYRAHLDFGYPDRYSMEDFIMMNDIVDIDEVLEEYESFKFERVIVRLQSFTKSEKVLEFIRAHRNTMREHPDDMKGIGEYVVYNYLRGQISIDMLPLTFTDMLKYKEYV